MKNVILLLMLLISSSLVGCATKQESSIKEPEQLNINELNKNSIRYDGREIIVKGVAVPTLKKNSVILMDDDGSKLWVKTILEYRAYDYGKAYTATGIFKTGNYATYQEGSFYLEETEIMKR